jgi:hypothetical protein
MAYYRDEPPRPGIVTVVGIISLVWSSLTVLRVIAWALVVSVLGFASWFLGPAVGAFGSLVGMLAILLMILHSLLSLLLFLAGWNTLRGDPSGRSLHQTWAWINIILDGLALLFSHGIAPGSWLGLAYAIALILIMDQPEVRAYFDHRSLPPGYKPEGVVDDRF